MNLDETGAGTSSIFLMCQDSNFGAWASLSRLGGYGEGARDDAEGV